MTPAETPSTHPWTKSHTLGLVAIGLGLPLVVWLGVSNQKALLAWLLSLVLMLSFVLVAGHGIIGAWRGALIDDRNVISLSRLQMLLWTVIILSAFLTAALWRVFLGIDDALSIAIPQTIWILMGISTTSLVGTPLILTTKKQKNLDDQDQKDLADTKSLLAKQGDGGADVTNKGLVIANNDPMKARWSDMFTGDEVSNGAHLDLSKIQMFFFTFVVAIAYCVALGHQFAAGDASAFNTFPKLDEGALALIGISHAGYLGFKAMPHGST